MPAKKSAPKSAKSRKTASRPAARKTGAARKPEAARSRVAVVHARKSAPPAQARRSQPAPRRGAAGGTPDRPPRHPARP